MSAKIAKAIRNEIGYHPTDERKYIVKGTTIEVAETDKRSLYQELKKEAYQVRKEFSK